MLRKLSFYAIKCRKSYSNQFITKIDSYLEVPIMQDESLNRRHFLVSRPFSLCDLSFYFTSLLCRSCTGWKISPIFLISFSITWNLPCFGVIRHTDISHQFFNCLCKYFEIRIYVWKSCNFHLKCTKSQKKLPWIPLSGQIFRILVKSS